VPLQTTPLARWNGAPDDATKPIAWLLLDFQADLQPSAPTLYQLVRTPRSEGESCQGTPSFAQLGDIQIRALFLP
jgi:hypothetical protein